MHYIIIYKIFYRSVMWQKESRCILYFELVCEILIQSYLLRFLMINKSVSGDVHVAQYFSCPLIFVAFVWYILLAKIGLVNSFFLLWNWFHVSIEYDKHFLLLKFYCHINSDKFLFFPLKIRDHTCSSLDTSIDIRIFRSEHRVVTKAM